MPLIKHKYLKVFHGRMTAAIIELEITPNDLKKHQIVIETEKIPFRSQGQIEGGHENWNLSAEQAILTALKNTPSSQCYDIVVKKIEGRLFLDTNNASVGVAGILALWEYWKINLSDPMLNKIHQFVSDNWKEEIDKIPNFNSLFEQT